MSVSTKRISIGLITWAAFMVGALSIAAWPSHLGHGICGPWGCGPPLQALIACHLAWFVALIPPPRLLTSSMRMSGRFLIASGIVLVILASSGFLALLAHQYLVWWPQATEWQHPYFWQRYVFTIVTSIDVPLIQVMLIGVALTCVGFNRSRRSAKRKPQGAAESELVENISELNLGVRSQQVS